MTKWEELHVTEPPVTAVLLDGAIEAARDQPLELPGFPCHAQSVDRCVKLVTEASLAVYGQERQNVLIVARQASRKARPSFDVKSDFVV